jgi:hypothetical protein
MIVLSCCAVYRQKDAKVANTQLKAKLKKGFIAKFVLCLTKLVTKKLKVLR